MTRHLTKSSQRNDKPTPQAPYKFSTSKLPPPTPPHKFPKFHPNFTPPKTPAPRLSLPTLTPKFRPQNPQTPPPNSPKFRSKPKTFFRFFFFCKFTRNLWYNFPFEICLIFLRQVNFSVKISSKRPNTTFAKRFGKVTLHKKGHEMKRLFATLTFSVFCAAALLSQAFAAPAQNSRQGANATQNRANATQQRATGGGGIN